MSHAANGNLIVNGSFETAAEQSVSETLEQRFEGGMARRVVDSLSVSGAGVSGWASTQRMWYINKGNGIFPDRDWAVRIDANANVDDVDVLAQGGLKLEAGVTYVLSFEMFGENPRTADLIVRLTDAEDVLDRTAGKTVANVLQHKSTVGDDRRAELVRVEFKPPATATYALQFFIDPKTNNDNHVWIDDVRLMPIDLVDTKSTSELEGE